MFGCLFNVRLRYRAYMNHAMIELQIAPHQYLYLRNALSVSENASARCQEQ